MIDGPVPPRFFSLQYHTVFFPGVLKDRAFRKKPPGGTTFTSTLEMIVCFVICVILAIIGIPLAVVEKSIAGWVMTILGAGGLVTLLWMSIGGQWGYKPTYSNFLTGVFFFFVSLGLLAGIPIGMDNHSFWMGAATSVAGLIAGYAVGIFAGLWLQRLGWFAVILNLVAAIGAVVCAGTALIMVILLMTTG